jgi:hypothetical protein
MASDAEWIMWLVQLTLILLLFPGGHTARGDGVAACRHPRTHGRCDE